MIVSIFSIPGLSEPIDVQLPNERNVVTVLEILWSQFS